MVSKKTIPKKTIAVKKITPKKEEHGEKMVWTDEMLENFNEKVEESNEQYLLSDTVNCYSTLFNNFKDLNEFVSKSEFEEGDETRLVLFRIEGKIEEVEFLIKPSIRIMAVKKVAS